MGTLGGKIECSRKAADPGTDNDNPLLSHEDRSIAAKTLVLLGETLIDSLKNDVHPAGQYRCQSNLTDIVLAGDRGHDDPD